VGFDPRGQLIQANGHGLAQVHRGLCGFGGDDRQQMTVTEVVAGEAAFLRTKHQRNLAAARQLAADALTELGQRHNRLLGLATGKRPGAHHQRAIGDGFGKALCARGVLENGFGADGRLRLPPVRLIRRDDGEMLDAEVRHGPRRRSNIERVARRNQDNLDAVELSFGEQGAIVVRAFTPRLAIRKVGKLQRPMVPVPDQLQSELNALCATARWCYARGWVPATSGNFSVRTADGPDERIFITPSGLDKGLLTSDHLLEIDRDGRPVTGEGKPSAETGLHTVIYRERPGANSILHVHTIWNTIFSSQHSPQGYLTIEGYELLKGLSGVTTHEHLERIPIIENCQKYDVLAIEFEEVLRTYPHAHGVLLARHGLYTWGQSVAEARRHLEALEFLFEVEARRLMGHVIE
jgi:methylthioribulose-1-phosphate dehydratase